jgi:hypothetical protein
MKEIIFEDTGSRVRMYPAPGQPDLEGIISDTCAGSFKVARDLWGLAPPRDCRIYVMTTWWRLFFDATPWYQKPFLITSMPFWVPAARRIWPKAGAMTLKGRFTRRVTIGVKPPDLLKASDTSVGELLYVKEPDMQVKLRHLVCHELTHACSAELRLPMWLNEGIAMLSVERYLGKRVISQDSLALLRNQPPRCTPPSYREMTRMDARGMALHTSRGYWLVELLEKTRPGFLKGIFSDKSQLRAREQLMAGLLSLPPEHFWQQVDDRLLGT